MSFIHLSDRSLYLDECVLIALLVSAYALWLLVAWLRRSRPDLSIGRAVAVAFIARFVAAAALGSLSVGAQLRGGDEAGFLGRANELALLGGRLSAQEAYEWGLVNLVSEDGESVSDAVAMARRFDELSVSVASIKEAHQRALQADLGSQLDHEADTQGRLQEQPDFAEATQAFTQKRPARFAERRPPVRTS